MEITHLFAINALVSITAFILLWLINLHTRDPSFIDAWWALGMVLIAFLSLLSTGQGRAHAILLTGLCGLWGLRLGIYLLWRWRRQGPDPRYAAMMAHARQTRGWGHGRASLLLVFALQAPLQFVVSLPVQLGQVDNGDSLGALAWIGAAVALAGVIIESVADFQLLRFKRNPLNHGKVLDSGLWRYSRHPNYFGEACVWWGLFLIAADAGRTGWWSLPGPVLLTVLLTRWSGVPTVEGRMGRRPDYEAYVARTSSFIPWPPRADRASPT